MKVVKRAPDRAPGVTIRAESRARDEGSTALNSDAMNAVMAKLKGMAWVRTRSGDIAELQPEFDYANGQQTLRGYVARNTVEVRLDDMTRRRRAQCCRGSRRDISVGGLQFDLKDREGAEREALRLAVRDARGRADAAANGAG